jgi:hypothetical protein
VKVLISKQKRVVQSLWFLCYNAPLIGADDTLFFDAGSDVGAVAEARGSTVFSIIGESTIAEPSNTPEAFASSTIDKEGFKTAGATVGLLPDDGLFEVEVSVRFILAAL